MFDTAATTIGMVIEASCSTSISTQYMNTTPNLMAANEMYQSKYGMHFDNYQ